MTRKHKMVSEELRRQGEKHNNEVPFHAPGWPYSYRADIYLSRHNAVIEVDGPSHNGREWRDRIRDRRFYRDLGIRTVRIKNPETEPDAYRAVRNAIYRLDRLGR